MRKITGKRFGGAVLLLLTVCVALSLSVTARSYVAHAAQHETNVVDRFDTLSDSENWIRNDFQMRRENYSVTFAGPLHEWDSPVLFTDYKIEGDCEIRFKITAENMPSDGQGADWFGIQFGHESAQSATLRAAAMLVCHRDYIQLMDRNDGKETHLSDRTLSQNLSTDKINPDTGKRYEAFDDSMIAKALRGMTNVKFVLRKTSEVQSGNGKPVYELQYYCWSDSQLETMIPIISWNIAADGYFGFSMFNNMSVRIYDFEIRENNERVAYSDLSDTENSLGYDTTEYTWCVNKLSPEQVMLGADTVISTDEVNNGMLLSKKAITTDPHCEEQFSIALDVNVESLANQSSFGIGFGLSPYAVTPDENNFAGIQGMPDGQWRFVLTKYGKEKMASVQYDNLPSGTQKLHFVGYYDGSIEVSFGTYSEVFAGMDFAGNFAVATMGDIASEIVFDNVSIKENHSVEIANQPQDMAIDFTGLRETQDEGQTYYGKYVDDTKWFRGSGVTIPRYSSKQERNYVQFANANEKSVFGSKWRYEQFICRFGITVSQNKDDASTGSAIGLSFGKTGLLSGYDTCPGIFFVKSDNGMRMRVYNAACDEAVVGGYVHIGNTYNLWESNDAGKNPVTYRVMVVAGSGVAKVYFAPEGADAAEMQICRATLRDFNGYGYVTVAGFGGASFHLEDFSIVNTTGNAASSMAKEDVLRLTEDEMKEFTAENSAKWQDGAVRIGVSSSLKTSRNYTDFLARIDITASNASGFSVTFGNGSAIRFTKEGLVSSLDKTVGQRQFEYDDLIAGGTILLEAMNGKLIVGVSKKNAPERFLFQPIAIYDYDGSAGCISVSTDADTTVSLSEFNVYSLRPTVQIERDDYKDGKGAFAVKPAPVGVSNDGDGRVFPVWGIVLIAVGTVVVCAGAIVAVVLCVRRKKRNEKE